MIVCNVRPHLSLRLGAASILPFLRGIVPPARVQPPCLLSLLLLKTVSERRASARIPVTSKGVTCDSSRKLHIAVLLRLLSQSRVSVRVASPVALGPERAEGSQHSTLKRRLAAATRAGTPTEAEHRHTAQPGRPTPGSAPAGQRACPSTQRHCVAAPALFRRAPRGNRPETDPSDTHTRAHPGLGASGEPRPCRRRSPLDAAREAPTGERVLPATPTGRGRRPGDSPVTPRGVGLLRRRHRLHSVLGF